MIQLGGFICNMNLAIEIPMPLPSTANLREHPMKRHSRVARQRAVVAMVLRSKWKKTFPCAIKLTRVAPRPLDGHDNLRSALKACVDGIADWLGVKDNDPRVQWDYDQDRGKPKYQAVRIELTCP
jgi:hypothetical protein